VRLAIGTTTPVVCVELCLEVMREVVQLCTATATVTITITTAATATRLLAVIARRHPVRRVVCIGVGVMVGGVAVVEVVVVVVGGHLREGLAAAGGHRRGGGFRNAVVKALRRGVEVLVVVVVRVGEGVAPTVPTATAAVPAAVPAVPAIVGPRTRTRTPHCRPRSVGVRCLRQAVTVQVRRGAP